MRLKCIEDWVPEANRWLVERVWKHDAKSILLPAGETPRKLYASWRDDPPTVLAHLRMMQLDEIISGPKAGLFARFFEQELPDWPVDLPLCYMRSDLAILGLGMNGHVAFHEPGQPLSFRHGEVALSPHSAQMLDIRSGTAAVTYGVAALMEAKALLLLVMGERKRSILEHCLDGEDLPATALLRHEDLTILTDIPIRDTPKD